MMRILAIATNTYREAVRDKILYALLLVAMALMCGAALVAELTIGEYGRVLKDLGLAGINAVGLVIAVFVGIGLVWKELERKTIYTIASKPISRWEFLLGKYLGLVGTLATEVVMMSAGLAVVLAWTGVSVDWVVIPALWLLFVELLVVTAIALLFGSFTTPTLATAFTLAITLIGRSTASLVEVAAATQHQLLQQIAGLLYTILPDLRTFNLRPEAASGRPVEWEFVAYATGYGLLWTAVFLTLATLIFQRRDFK